MAVCNYCAQEMKTADGCTEDPISMYGRSFRPVRYGQEPGWRDVTERCGDCGVLPGAVHHHGCDVERCPFCGYQSISCGCVWAGEEHRSEEWIDELEERFASPH